MNRRQRGKVAGLQKRRNYKYQSFKDLAQILNLAKKGGGKKEHLTGGPAGKAKEGVKPLAERETGAQGERIKKHENHENQRPKKR